MKIDFTGQVVLVTGATRGIGKQLADDFARLGASLILTGTREDQIEALNKSTGSGQQYYRVDFTDRHSTEMFLRELGAYERIDVCINNAGINRINYIDETRIEDWDDITMVNLRAPFLITRQVGKLMKKNRYGRIVNISSIWGVISKEQRSIYSSTKFGLRGMTVAAANELARYNVLVNSIAPGFVLTDMTKAILGEKEMQELADQVPARRLATTKDISAPILFLASSLNTYIVGQNIIVDGGFVNV